MRNSLIFKLLGAFFLVVAIGVVVISVLTSQATQKAFTLYTTRSGQVWAQRLAPDLADYYSQTENWQGVEAALQSILDSQSFAGGLGNGMGQGRGFGAGSQNGNGMMAGSGQRLILTDDKGMVVGDTQGSLVGKQISSDERKSGASITVNNKLVGTLFVTPIELPGSNTPAAEFLTSVNQAIASSAGIAGLVALVLGTILFIQIIKPLRQLKKATAAIASGDLRQRVDIRSRDELGELGATFNKMAENLANAETQRQHLVADVAHELRTPLAAIQGTLEGIQDGVLPTDKEQVEALYAETLLLNRLVDDLKLLSLAEAGQLKLDRQETEPVILIQQIVERAKIQADSKNVSLIAELESDLPHIWIDSDRITQVLNNLIGNSLRYTPGGGKITIHGSVLAPGKFVQISVSDTGPGIDSADLPFIFDRFYRADKSRSRSSGGSGLGLAIVKQLVEAHGGRVQGESPVNQSEADKLNGARISFTLPISNQ